MHHSEIVCLHEYQLNKNITVCLHDYDGHLINCLTDSYEIVLEEDKYLIKMQVTTSKIPLRENFKERLLS